MLSPWIFILPPIIFIEKDISRLQKWNCSYKIVSSYWRNISHSLPSWQYGNLCFYINIFCTLLYWSTDQYYFSLNISEKIILNNKARKCSRNKIPRKSLAGGRGGEGRALSFQYQRKLFKFVEMAIQLDDLWDRKFCKNV